MTPIMEELLKKMVAELKTSLTNHIETMNAESTERTTALINARVQPLEVNCKSLQSRLEDLERHSRLSNLVFHGIPPLLPNASADVDTPDHTSQSETEHAIIANITQLCRDRLNLDITTSDISTAHRLRSSNKNNYNPLIVSFTNRRARNEVFRAKKLLGKFSHAAPNHLQLDTRIYINEHLTPQSAHIYAEARKKVKDKILVSTWTYEGRVYVRESTSADVHPLKILS